jgi:putative nucleotidyltransferase with HDIG domain
MLYCKTRITEALVQFFDKDYRRIEHALSVLKNAERIAETTSGVDSEILIAAALLHDVGIKPAEKIHGYNDGPLQEQYGPSEAQRLLQGIGFPHNKTAKVMEIIGNHHSRSRFDYVELAILKEADAIVNRFEESEMKDAP